MGDYHRGGGRGGYGGDQRRGGGQHHAGQKRGREEAPAAHIDYRRNLVARLMAVGDAPAGGSSDSYDRQLDELVRVCKREIKYKNEQAHEVVMECCVQLSTKTPHFAALLGLLNVDEPGFVGRVVSLCANELSTCLAQGERHRSRLLLRLFVALAAVNVLPAPAVTDLLTSLVDAAVCVADLAGDVTGLTWQPWGDQLVYCALAALPWGGGHLAEAAPGQLGGLWSAVARYMAARPVKSASPEFMPFGTSGSAVGGGGGGSEDDAAAASDSGGASFLPALWAAVQECQVAADWHVASIPSFSDKVKGGGVAAAAPLELPAVQVPQAPPGLEDAGSPAAGAALLRRMFPPRGGIRLLDRSLTEGSAGGKSGGKGQGGSEAAAAAAGNRVASIERFVAEEYMLDTLAAFEGDRPQCAKRLCCGLPLPYDYTALLAETLFAQMLRLPTPEHKAVSYSGIMVDVCKLNRDFARPMSSCVRELFSRMTALDPRLRARLADWLAYHLSHFSYVWPWTKWERVLAAPPSDAQRLFCADVLLRLQRLSYHDRVVKSLTEAGADGFLQLLGPKPAARLPGAGRSADPSAAGEPAASSSSSSSALLALPPSEAEAAASAKIMEFIRSRTTGTDMLLWVDTTGQEAALGGPRGVVRAALAAGLSIGVKSLSHMYRSLQRLAALLNAMLDRAAAAGGSAAEGEGGSAGGATGRVQAESDVVAYFGAVFEELPQTLVVAVEQLMALRIISCDAVVSWATACGGLASAGPSYRRYAGAWSALGAAVEMQAVLSLQLPAEASRNNREALSLALTRKLRSVDAADEASKAAERALNTPQQADALAAAEAAAAAEDAAEARVKALEAKHSELTDQAADAAQELDRAVVHAYSCLTAWVASVSAPSDEDDAVMDAGGGDVAAASESTGAQRTSAALAQVKSFARRFYVESLRVVEQLLVAPDFLRHAAHGNEAAAAAVRQALQEVLSVPSSGGAAGGGDGNVSMMS